MAGYQVKISDCRFVIYVFWNTFISIINVKNIVFIIKSKMSYTVILNVINFSVALSCLILSYPCHYTMMSLTTDSHFLTSIQFWFIRKFTSE